MWRLLLIPWALLPWGLLGWPVLIAGWAFGYVRPLGVDAGAVLWAALPDRGWWSRAWVSWGGTSAVPLAVVLRWDRVHDAALRAHELRHVRWWYLLGPLHPLVYLLGGLWALAAGGRFYDDNPLERDATRAEGR